VLNPELLERENVERLIRDVGEEEVMRVLAQLMENQKKIFELQKQLQKENTEKKRRKQQNK